MEKVSFNIMTNEKDINNTRKKRILSLYTFYKSFYITNYLIRMMNYDESCLY